MELMHRNFTVNAVQATQTYTPAPEPRALEHRRPSANVPYHAVRGLRIQLVNYGRSGIPRYGQNPCDADPHPLHRFLP